MHFGRITFDVDERWRSRDDLTQHQTPVHRPTRNSPFYGGHVMAMVGSKMFVEGVEFNRMGQEHDSRPISDPLGT